MQGTAADLIKLAMVAVQAALDAHNKASRIVMQVHDELVLEVPEAELERVKERIPELMTGVAELRVPLVADLGAGELLVERRRDVAGADAVATVDPVNPEADFKNLTDVPLATNMIWLRVLVAFDIVFTGLAVVFIDDVLVG